MFGHPTKEFIYSAYRVETLHHDNVGTKKLGTASAFLLGASTGQLWVVTNRHVLDLNYRETTGKYKEFSLAELRVSGRRADDSTYTLKLHRDSAQYVHSDPENDIVLVEARVDPAANDPWHWCFGIEQLADALIFRSIQPLDLICYTSFPEQHDKLGGRPILRSGRIASDPQFNYSWDKKARGQCVAYEGFSSPGSSGAPVYAPPRGMTGIPNSRHGYLVGVNSLHFNASLAGHSGISCFYKSTVIIEILEQHGLVAQPHVPYAPAP
jgi:hypothetical protein